MAGLHNSLVGNAVDDHAKAEHQAFHWEVEVDDRRKDVVGSRRARWEDPLYYRPWLLGMDAGRVHRDTTVAGSLDHKDAVGKVDLREERDPSSRFWHHISKEEDLADLQQHLQPFHHLHLFSTKTNVYS